MGKRISQKNKSVLAGQLVRQGVVKGSKDAHAFLIILALVCFASAAYISYGSEIKAAVFQPTVYREDIPADVLRSLPSEVRESLPSRGQ